MRELLKNYNFLDFMYTAQERYGRMYKLRLEEEITYEKQEFLDTADFAVVGDCAGRLSGKPG